MKNIKAIASMMVVCSACAYAQLSSFASHPIGEPEVASRFKTTTQPPSLSSADRFGVNNQNGGQNNPNGGQNNQNNQNNRPNRPNVIFNPQPSNNQNNNQNGDPNTALLNFVDRFNNFNPNEMYPSRPNNQNNQNNLSLGNRVSGGGQSGSFGNSGLLFPDDKLPVDAKGNADYVKQFESWDPNKVPFWLLNHRIIETARNSTNPKQYYGNNNSIDSRLGYIG